MFPSGHGIASIAAGFLESGPTIEGNDGRLAMIRQALETECGRRVTAGPKLTGADNLRAGRPGSDREADPLCTRLAPGSGRGASPRTATRGPKTRRAPLGSNRRLAARTERTNDPMQFHMLRTCLLALARLSLPLFLDA